MSIIQESHTDLCQFLLEPAIALVAVIFLVGEGDDGID